MSNAIWTLVEVAANLIESLLCIHFLVGSFNGRIRVLGTRTVYIIGVLCMTAFVTALNKVITYEGMYGLLYAALFFIYSVIFFQGTLLKKIFISVLVDLCLISSAAVSENILFVFFKDDLDRIYTSHSYERIVFMIVGISLLAYVLALLMRFTSGKKDKDFKELPWWQLHMTERHHLNDSVPEDVNLLDVLEMVIDCTVAGLARGGSADKIYPITIPQEVLNQAIDNTKQLIIDNTKLED